MKPIEKVLGIAKIQKSDDEFIILIHRPSSFEQIYVHGGDLTNVQLTEKEYSVRLKEYQENPDGFYYVGIPTQKNILEGIKYWRRKWVED